MAGAMCAPFLVSRWGRELVNVVRLRVRAVHDKFDFCRLRHSPGHSSMPSGRRAKFHPSWVLRSGMIG